MSKHPCVSERLKSEIAVAESVLTDRDPLLTREEAAQYLNLSVATLESDASRPRLKIPYLKLGKSVRYSKRDLDSFRSRCRIDPSAPTA